MRSSRAFLLFPLLLLALSAALPAQIWRPLGPFGGDVATLTVAPSDNRVVYATTRYGGAFVSLNDGATWRPIHGGIAFGAVAVEPAEPGWILLSTSTGGLSSSHQYGFSWSPFQQGLSGAPVTAVAVDPLRPARMYAAQGARVFRTLNRGGFWHPPDEALPISGGPTVSRLLAVSRPQGTLFALAEEQVFRSADSGRTWHPVAGGLPNGVLALEVSTQSPWLLFAAAREDRGAGLYRSGDAGATWQRVHRFAASVLSLAISPHSARVVWVGTEGRGLLQSTDGGLHFKAAGPAGVSAVPAVAAARGRVFAAVRPQGTDPGGIFTSDDGGATWVRHNRGLAGLEASAVIPDPTTPGALWISRGDLALGLAHGLAGPGGLPRWAAVPLRAAALAESPSAPATLYASSAPRLWRTDDAGSTWTEIVGPQGPAMPGGDLWVDPLSPETLWSNGSGLQRSVDGGTTWARRALPSSGVVKLLAFASGAPATKYAAGFDVASDRSTRLTAWRSTDGGATWRTIEQGLGSGEPTDLAVDPVDSRRVYMTACGSYCSPVPGLWRSTDGGETWALTGPELADHAASAVAASPIAGLVWVAVEDGRIFRSLDGGETWHERPGLQARAVYHLVLDPSSPRRLYAATSSGVWLLEDTVP